MKRTIFLVICIGFYFTNQAQIPKAPTSLLSPTTANLGLYGEVPVSLYTGTPSIEIPIYEVSQNRFKLPISLSYHASGIRPDQHPGWTGLGWNLNTGGVITRIVNDLPDENINTNLTPANGSYYYCGYFYNHNILNGSNWNRRTYLRQIAQGDESLFKDTQPDEFSFNFLDYHGKFLIGSDGSWKVQCDKPLKIIFDNQYLNIPFDISGTELQNVGCPPSFKGFTIISENGTKYFFGGDNTSLEYSIDFFNQSGGNWVATTWHLTKIILPNGSEINYTYERDNFINQMYLSINHDLGTFGEYTFNNGIFNLNLGCSSTSYTSIEYGYGGNLISPIYLKTITTPDCIISFDRSFTMELRYSNSIYNYAYTNWYNSTSSFQFLKYLNSTQQGYPQCLENLKWYKLDKISIKRKDDSILKSFNFIYNNTGVDRLFLTSVVEKGTDGQSKLYTFDYYNKTLLPPYLSNKVDHWGFFNNKYAAIDNYSNYYNLREADPNYTLYGVLSKITYPTGGYTRFIFEPHNYRKQLSLKRWESCNELPVNKLAGGVRIKQIINSPTGNIQDEYINKEYYYTSDYLQNKENSIKSSGVLGGQIQYFFDQYIVYSFNDNNARMSKTLFSSQSVLPCSNNTYGNHIGYTEVIEKCNDSTFTRYIFTNFDNGRMDEAADTIIQLSSTPYEPYASKDQERGLLLFKEDYNTNGVKVKKSVMDYVKSDNSSFNYVRSMKASNSNICPTISTSYDEGSAYKIYTYSMLLSHKKEITYNNTDSLINETKFKYDTNYPIIVNQTEKDSHGDSITTVYTYPFHVDGQYYAPAPGTSSSAGSRVISTTLATNCKSMKYLNFLNSPIEILIYKNRNVIGGKLFYYGMHGTSNYLPDSIYSIETSSPLSTFCRYSTPTFPQYIVDGRYEKSPSISYKYDSKSNITQITEKGISTAYLWGYNYQYPIAEIKNATIDKVTSLLGGISVVNNLALSNTITDENIATLNSLKSNLPTSQITIYTYKQLVGIVRKIDPNGVVTNYEYDNFNRLKWITDTNDNLMKEYQYHYYNQ
ncbi:MAG: hypothetical protein PHR83_07100 [Paludibacter sp.]|nr:hypothetical protein [Paludibacter sp.]